MSFLVQLFDLFNALARKLAGYLPQSGGDVIRLFKQFFGIATVINDWMAQHVGVNFYLVLNSLGKLAFAGFQFFIELIKTLVSRLH